MVLPLSLAPHFFSYVLSRWQQLMSAFPGGELQKLFLARLKLGTFRVLGGCNNHNTKKTTTLAAKKQCDRLSPKCWDREPKYKSNDGFPTPGIEPGPRRSKCRILTTRPCGSRHHKPGNNVLKSITIGQKTKLNRPRPELSSWISCKFLNCPTKIGHNQSIKSTFFSTSQEYRIVGTIENSAKATTP